MDSILRSVIIYMFLLVVFRLSGKRALTQVTTFDFVLLLIIGEATQQGLLGNDFSITNALLVIITLVALDKGLGLMKQRSSQLDKWLDGTPLIIVENGNLLRDRMEKERVDERDIMTAAREMQGLERLDQIKYAVLERDGNISIIPAK